ncbi:MAG: hypothetical protein ACOC22_03345 [bacterium]
MWGINPELLCKKHLLGEHGEIHKHRYNFVKPAGGMVSKARPLPQL